MKNSTKYKAWRVIIDSIEGVEVKEDTENNQMVAIKENNIVGLFDLELDLGSVKENKPGWMLKQDPVLAAKVKSNVDLAKKRQAAYGDPDWQKKQDEKKELAKESWLADDYVTWVDDSSKAKTFTQAEAEIVAKQVNGLASPRFPDGEETNSYVVSNINQYESIREAALPEEDMIGGFRELSVGKNWWYGKTKYWWALEHDLPHELVSDHGNRYAKVLNTVAYVAVDENDDGTPKLEKWYIKHFQKKETV